MLKRSLSLLAILLWVAMSLVLHAQECSIGAQAHRNTKADLATIKHWTVRPWSSTGRRVPKSMLVANSNPFQGSGRALGPDFPIERCAILAMTGVGVGYLADGSDMWVGLPAVAVAVAMPFPGQERRGRFQSRRRIGKKLLGVFAFSVSYAVGVGIGQNMKHEPVH